MNTEISQGALLIVDDMPANISVLSNFLEEKGFEILIAQNGKRAIKKAEYAQPDLILLDVMMPEMNGFEACKILKLRASTQDIPVIFMTALSDTVDKVKGFEMGAVDYITKPFQQEEVFARVHAHLTIRNLQKSLQQQNQELEAFSHTVAHDIKNPVAAVLGFTEILLDSASDMDKRTVDLIKRTHKAGKNIVNIIDALLLLASTNKQKVKMETVNMVKVVTQVLQRLEFMISEHQAKIAVSFNLPTALGYAPWIAEIWMNYITNALKYGGNPPRVELGATEQDDDYIRFWVRDNGKGLTEEEQEKLFMPFTRISQARIEGHGLGLSIVQRIIEKCGGEVGVESELGQGSTFYFTLPKSV